MTTCNGESRFVNAAVGVSITFGGGQTLRLKGLDTWDDVLIRTCSHCPGWLPFCHTEDQGLFFAPYFQYDRLGRKTSHMERNSMWLVFIQLRVLFTGRVLDSTPDKAMSVYFVLRIGEECL